jgi:hypothetical protein
MSKIPKKFSSFSRRYFNKIAGLFVTGPKNISSLIPPSNIVDSFQPVRSPTDLSLSIPREARRILAKHLSSFGLDSVPIHEIVTKYLSTDDPNYIRIMDSFLKLFYGGPTLSSEFPILSIDPKKWNKIRERLLSGQITRTKANKLLNKLIRQTTSNQEIQVRENISPNRQEFLEWLEKVRLKPKTQYSH